METLLHGSKRSILALFLFFGATLFAKQSFGQGSAPPFNTSGTFTVPAGVTSITVSVWGGGGAGGGVTDQPRGGGGGEGGSFVRGTIAVTPGTQYQVIVGSGGAGSTGSGTDGGPSSFGGTLFIAMGGAGGAVGNNLGAGGNTANTGNTIVGTATATVSNYGGIGATATSASTASSGGGGGSAGAGGAGGDGGVPTSPTSAGAAGAAGSPSAPGATGGAGRGASSDGNGNAGAVPGGGGGGGRNANNNNDRTGGDGGAGRVIITWTCPAATISYPPSICKSSSSVNATIDGGPGGTFSSTAGLTLNTSTGEINASTSTAGTYTVQYQIAGGSGCSAVNTSTSVIIRSVPVTSVSGQSDPNCFAGSDGTITIAVTGGTGPYFYSIDNGATWTPVSHASPYSYGSGAEGGLSAGIQYRIKVKDSNGCESK